MIGSNQSSGIRRSSLGIFAALFIISALILLARSRATHLPRWSAPDPVSISARAFTQERGNARTPAVSPDGTQVAFSWNGAGGSDYGIYIKPVAGDEPPRRLTEGGARDVYPVWSPDGRSIAFLRNPGDSASVIIKPLEGGEERKLLAISGHSIAWSRAANLLAVEECDPAMTQHYGIVGVGLFKRRKMAGIRSLDRCSVIRCLHTPSGRWRDSPSHLG